MTSKIGAETRGGVGTGSALLTSHPVSGGAGQAVLSPELCYTEVARVLGTECWIRSAVLWLELTLRGERGLGKEAPVCGAEEIALCVRW